MCERVAVQCPACGQSRLLAKSDAKKALARGSKCFHCSQVEKARKGYAACVKKHGAAYAVTMVQQYRLSNPSSLEQRVMQALNLLSVKVEREVLVVDGDRHYLVDFVLDGKLAIEVNGGCHVLHVQRDLLKANAVRRAGYRLLILTESDMRDLERVLRSFVEGVFDVQLPAVA